MLGTGGVLELERVITTILKPQPARYCHSFAWRASPGCNSISDAAW